MLKIIAAVDKRKRIACDGVIPWNIPEDLIRFKQITMDNAVVMGRKTWESLPAKPLKGRTNIVVSRNVDYWVEGENVMNALSLSDVMSVYEAAFIIGGAELYREALPYTDKVYLTRVDYDQHHELEVYFPWNDMWEYDWSLESCTRHNGYRFEEWVRCINTQI